MLERDHTGVMNKVRRLSSRWRVHGEEVILQLLLLWEKLIAADVSLLGGPVVMAVHDGEPHALHTDWPCCTSLSVDKQVVEEDTDYQQFEELSS